MPSPTPPATSVASARLARAMRSLRRGDPPVTPETMTAAAFRAAVAERLRALEREMADVRTRINGLLFVVAGAVVTQVVLRLFG